MCLAAQTISGSFKLNISELSSVRTNWTPEYASDLETRIDGVIENHLGIDAKKELRDASGTLSALMGPAKRDISFFKTQLEADFKEEEEKLQEILKNLGLTKSLRAAQKDDQEALIELLYAFKTNITDELKVDISSKGMNPVLIDRIIGYAASIKTANINQEGLKETTKEISEETTSAFNAIYDEVIGICKIASNFYQYEPLKKEQFTFSKVVANMSPTKKSPETPEE